MVFSFISLLSSRIIIILTVARIGQWDLKGWWDYTQVYKCAILEKVWLVPEDLEYDPSQPDLPKPLKSWD